MLLHRARAHDYLTACGLDAVIATSPVNVTYLSDFHCWLSPLFREYMVSPGGSSRLIQQNFAVLPAEGEPALVVEPYFAVDAVETWVTDIRIAGGGDFEDRGADDGEQAPAGRTAAVVDLIRRGAAHSPLDALIALLEERGLAGARLGVEFDGLDARLAERLRERLPRAELRDCTSVLRLIRAVKSGEELERLRAAATAAEEAGQAAFALGGAGVRTGELERVYRAGLGERGADFDHFAFGPRGVGISSSGAYAMARSDVIYVDWGCLIDGYCSDTGTTLVVGELSPEWARRFEATVASVQAGLAAARPGVLASAVQAAMASVMRQAGITDSYPHGHGFGLDVRDYPIICPPNGRTIRDECIEVSSDLPLEDGMVFNLEAPLFVLGAGAVHTERSFVVGADGSEPLVPQERDSPVVVGGVPDGR